MKLNIDELKSLIVLSSIEFLTPAKMKLLIEKFGSATNVIDATLEDLKNVGSINESLALKILESKNEIEPDKELYILSKNNIKLITYYDDDYPVMLKYLADPPILLYVDGELKEIDNFSLSVVGTRTPTSYGKAVIEYLIKELSKYNFTIVSGLAYGIDTLAHKYAIDNGLRTIAVIGNGLGVYYPASNKELQRKIAKCGAVISEFPYNRRPDKLTFPRRNRIIAAFSLGTVVIEADIKSGALITSDYAVDLGKDVFAIPGSIFSKKSRGTNYLIKKGAKMVTEVDDIIEEIITMSNLIKDKLKHEKFIDKGEKLADIPVSDKAREILEILEKEDKGIHIDQIQNITNIEIRELLRYIFELQLIGKIKELPGKIFMVTK
ncbi:MAG: DNA-processing protein DprA [Endomicrobia bacterium]|nr:DNA-processing protein DprA [Endomicrobiia bacterium]